MARSLVRGAYLTTLAQRQQAVINISQQLFQRVGGTGKAVDLVQVFSQQLYHQCIVVYTRNELPEQLIFALVMVSVMFFKQSDGIFFPQSIYLHEIPLTLQPLDACRQQDVEVSTASQGTHILLQVFRVIGIVYHQQVWSGQCVESFYQ